MYQWNELANPEERDEAFKRLGSYEGNIPYFRTSQYGIELALAQEGDIETYLQRNGSF